MHASNCCSDNCEYPRSFLTKEEKIEILQEYKESLEKEAKGVGEKMEQIQNNN